MGPAALPLSDVGARRVRTRAGTRQVGLFWSKALGWPLVWDRGQQTAIQSPRGGTKLAWDTWDGTPVTPKAEPSRQRRLPDRSTPTNVLIQLLAFAKPGDTSPA
jgi:hypothetical protein